MNKTTICSVVFLDIVEYSKKSVVEQIKLKNQFNALISEAIRTVPITDRIILDTGDGAAISFLGDPEDALLTAMKLRDAVLAEQDMPFFLRIGINLGPVRLVQDINRQPNIIGDGINVAQRIMSFAQPNQILVSRSFYDVISCVTDEYAKLFEFQGSRTDKHVREHEIYAVRNEVFGEDAVRASFKHSHAESPRQSPWWSDRDLLLKKIFPATALLLIAIAVLFKIAGKPAKVPAPAPLPSPATAPRPAVRPAVRPESAAVAAQAAAQSAPAAVKKTEKPTENRHEAVPVKKSTLIFRIMPWGEVYVDGKKRGVSPPLNSVPISPGRHEIEIRNTTFPAHSETVETSPGERVIIRHKF